MVSNQHLRIFFFFRLCLQHVKERFYLFVSSRYAEDTNENVPNEG